MPPKTRGAKATKNSTTERGESSQAIVPRRRTRGQQVEEENEGNRRRTGRGNRGERNVRFENLLNLDRENELKKRPIEPTRYIDEDELEMIGIQNEVRELIRNIGWESFVAIQEATYSNLLCRFLSTIRINIFRVKKFPMEAGTIQFSLGNREFSMSTAQFGVACGLYTEDEVQGGVMEELVSGFPSGCDLNAVWERIAPGKGRYNVKHTKSTLIPSSALRFMHRFVALTINARGDSQGAVTKTDLFYLWCMVSQKKCNTAYFLAKHLHHKSQGDRGKLCGGSYVTRLAKNLVVFSMPPDVIPITMQAITIDTLVRMNMLMRRADGTLQFVEDSDDDVQDRADGPAIDEQPLPESQHEHPPPVAQLPDDLDIGARLKRIEKNIDTVIRKQKKRVPIPADLDKRLGRIERRQLRIDSGLRKLMNHIDVSYSSSSATSEDSA